MKLFEVMYPKCKKCGYDFSKGGRDHRVGVCDHCAFPEKYGKKNVKEGYSEFTQNVQDLIWQEWQNDALLPAGVEYPGQMDDEDFLDFEEHVRDVIEFAKQHRINDAEKAVRAYDTDLTKQMRSDPDSPLFLQ